MGLWARLILSMISLRVLRMVGGKVGFRLGHFRLSDGSMIKYLGPKSPEGGGFVVLV